jgi:hypothetical protein
MELSLTAGTEDVVIPAIIPKKKMSDKMERIMDDIKKPNMEPNTILQNFLLPDSRFGVLNPGI